MEEETAPAHSDSLTRAVTAVATGFLMRNKDTIVEYTQAIYHWVLNLVGVTP